MTTTLNQPLTGNLLSNYKLYPTAHEVPSVLAEFQADVYGPGSVAKAVNDMLAGRGDKVAAFLAIQREEPELARAKVLRGLSFGIGEVEGVRCFRYVGEAGEPNGCGSSSVVATWYPEAMDAATVTGALVYNLRGGEIVRVALEGGK